MTLGMKIKESRLKARLSQEKVAELVGVSRQAVTKWESDQSAPNTENLFRLAEVLGTTVDFLIASEDDPRSVAEQVYQMLQDDQARKKAEIKHQRLCSFRCTLAVAGSYLLIFLLCKIFWTTADGLTVTQWLFGDSPYHHEYLFGWLIGNRIYFYASVLSILSAAIGLRRLSLTTLAAFAAGLPLGEYLGSLPGLVPEGYHYGWAIWGLLFIGSIFLGGWLQRFPAEELVFRSKKLRLWCVVTGVYAVGSIVFVLLNIPPAYY